MKKLLTQVLAVIAVLGVAVSVSAQAVGRAGQGKGKSAKFEKMLSARAIRQKRMQEALSKLNLTSEQKNKIAELKLKDMAALKELHKQVKAGSLSKQDAMAKRKEIVKSSRAEIKGILTPLQDRKFAAELKAMRKEGKKGATGKNIPPTTR